MSATTKRAMPMGRLLRGASKMCSAKLYPDRQQFTFSTTVLPVPYRQQRVADRPYPRLPLAQRCQRVDVDLEPRRATGPSDHTVLWADFALSNLVRVAGQGCEQPTPLPALL